MEKPGKTLNKEWYYLLYHDKTWEMIFDPSPKQVRKADVIVSTNGNIVKTRWEIP